MSVDSRLCVDDGAGNADQGTSVGTGAKVNVGSRVTKGKSKASSSGGGKATSTPVKLIEGEAGDAAKLPRRSNRKRKLDKGGKTSTISTPGDQAATGTGKLLQAPTETNSDKATAFATPVTKAPKMRGVDPSALKSSLVLPPVAKLTSQPLLMWDVNGMVSPLLDGLNLRPVTGKAGFPLPTMSYNFVSSRQHAITRTQNVCVLTLGKSLLTLLSVEVLGWVVHVGILIRIASTCMLGILLLYSAGVGITGTRVLAMRISKSLPNHSSFY